MSSDIVRQLDHIFRPKSFAVIGASNDPRKWGQWMVERPLTTGFKGAIYPVNPRESTIVGLPAYKSVLDIPYEVETAVITVPTAAVPEVMRECVAKGIKGVILISAGFAEVGEEGAAYQEEVLRIAQEGGIRFIGPNCMGVWNASAHFCLALAQAPLAGGISFVSQSGSFGAQLTHVATARGYGTNKFISIGNQADVSVADLLDYLAEDEDTKVIVLYLEGMSQGKRFLEAARRATLKKPIVVYKAGRTTAGARAASSHTASLAGTDQLFDALCRQTGMIRAYEAFHLFHMAEALVSQPIPEGNRIGIVMGGGGQCVVTADFSAAIGLEVPEFDPDTQAELRKEFSPHDPLPRNPVDLGAPGGVRTITAARIATLVERIAQVDYIDGIVTNVPGGVDMGRGFSTVGLRAAIDAAEMMSTVPERYGKPIIARAWRWANGGVAEDIFKAARIPIYETSEECAWAMYALAKYGEVLRRLGCHGDGC